MGDFVTNDTGQLLLGIQGRKKAAVNENMAGRRGKGVIHILMDHMKLVDERLGGGYFSVSDCRPG